MKIVIVDGVHEADYLINMYNNSHNELIVINSDENTCHYLAEKNNIEVYHGKSSKESDLANANIDGADFFIALSVKDIDNYVSCKLAKECFDVKRCIATCINPKNVDVFKMLGVDCVVSSTFLVAQQIQSTASIEKLVNIMSIEDNKINIMEVEIEEDNYVCNKSLMELKINDLGSVSCIYSSGRAVIPNGSSRLHAHDKVLLVCTKEKKDDLLKFFQRKVNES